MEPALALSKTPGPVTPTVMPHIVALDDDATVRALIAEYLGKNELRVTTVGNGRELADVFARESIDAVILDLRLPGEDGMQIARQLRERSSVPILMLTGITDEADRVMGL
jgi:DNA-binding response OmpR family regulator